MIIKKPYPFIFISTKERKLEKKERLLLNFLFNEANYKEIVVIKNKVIMNILKSGKFNFFNIIEKLNELNFEIILDEQTIEIGKIFKEIKVEKGLITIKFSEKTKEIIKTTRLIRIDLSAQINLSSHISAFLFELFSSYEIKTKTIFSLSIEKYIKIMKFQGRASYTTKSIQNACNNISELTTINIKKYAGMRNKCISKLFFEVYNK